MIISCDLPSLLSYMGVIATILFGIWGLYIAIKYRRFVRISFVLRKKIALFNTVVKNIPELSILYKESPINQNLLFIEGALINTGNTDIVPAMIEKPICFNVPENYKWLTAKVIFASNNAGASITLSDLALTLNSGLFKLNEYICFQALLQAPHDDNIVSIENKIDKIIKYSHRIADMPKIKSIKLLNINIKDIAFLIGLLFYFIIGASFMGYFSMNQKIVVNTTVYSYKKPNNEIIKVMVKESQGDYFTIEGVDMPYKEKLHVREFIKKTQKKGEEPYEITLKTDKIFLAICIVVIIGSLLFLAILFREYRMNNKLSKIFDIE